jgi:trehalose 6-phosphate phosphatase
MPAHAAEVLAVLARHLAVVALVSGRPASFLADRAAIEGVRLLGLYGTEEWQGDRAVARPEVAAFTGALDQARELVTLALAGHEGVLFEDKGLALALHWRNAPDRTAAGRFVTALMTSVGRETGLAFEPGKFVVELRPPVGWDKGSSVAALVDEGSLDVVVYGGDDLGDLPAFAAARAAGGYALVVDHGSETPPEVIAAADVVVRETAGVHTWLADLAGRLT